MTGERHCYRGYGLIIDSEIEIPGAVPVTPCAAQPDIVIRVGSAAIGAVDGTNGPYSTSGDALLFDLPGVARYLAQSAGQLVIDPYAGSDLQDVSALLVATALPMLLWMRGGFVLHAAGLILPDASSAIALAGPSGIGKSSLAHQLLADGARLLGDDTLLVSVDGARSVVSGLPASYFLPGSSAEQREMRHVLAHRQADTTQLGAIIALVPASHDKVQAPSRVGGLAALEVLLQNRHRTRVPTIIGRNRALLPICVLHCRNVPIYRLEIPTNDLAAAQACLTALLDGIGELN
jgi:hypothetical protein